MQNAVISSQPAARPQSYIEQLSPAEISILLDKLSPAVREELEQHLTKREEQPRASIPTCWRPDRGLPSVPSQPQPRPPSTAVVPQHGMIPLPPSAKGPPTARIANADAPLLARAAVQALLPTEAPTARRNMRDHDSTGRSTATAQRRQREAERHALRCDQARQATEAERARLYRIALQQQQALQTSAVRLAALQASCDEREEQLRQEKERSRTLERGFRAMARESLHGSSCVKSSHVVRQPPHASNTPREQVEWSRVESSHATPRKQVESSRVESSHVILGERHRSRGAVEAAWQVSGLVEELPADGGSLLHATPAQCNSSSHAGQHSIDLS